MKIKTTLPFKVCVIAIVVLSFTSCKRDVEDRLPGDWNYSEAGTSTVDYNGNATEQEINNTGTATFIDDGTGSITVGTTISKITWEVSSDTINIIKEGKSFKYFIANNEKTLQEWETIFVETGTDFTYTSDVKVTLTQ
ncbi:MAG: hypothetical protein ACJA0Q_001976 [Saprospiraceae bacterium]|jgi:hypothetical protein